MAEAQHKAMSMSLGQGVRAGYVCQQHDVTMPMTGMTASGCPLPAAAAVVGPTSYHPGMVSLPGHTQLVQTASALLTGLVLPERPAFHAAAVGRTRSHTAAAETVVPLSRAQSLCPAHHLGVGLSTGPDGCSLPSTTATPPYSSISSAAGASCGQDSTSFAQGSLGLWPPVNVDMAACLPVQGVPKFEDHSTSHASQGPLLVVGPHGEVRGQHGGSVTHMHVTNGDWCVREGRKTGSARIYGGGPLNQVQLLRLYFSFLFQPVYPRLLHMHVTKKPNGHALFMQVYWLALRLVWTCACMYVALWLITTHKTSCTQPFCMLLAF